MSKKSVAVMILLLLSTILYVSTAFAETTFSAGAAFRLRQEIWDDVFSLDTITTSSTPDRNFYRLRTSLWGKADFDKDTSAYLKFTNELKYYMGPFRLNGQRLEENEVIFDNLYISKKNLFGLPVDIKVGRQDFLGPDTYGEGFLIMDGTPGDGSRSFYFNAAKASVRFAPNHSVDLVYITDRKTDTLLPSLHSDIPNSTTYFDDKVITNTSNEQGFVVYFRDKINDNLSVEPYYIWKRENTFTNPDKSVTPELDLNTMGLRAVFTFGDGWKVNGEFAHQFGDYTGGRDRDANGGYLTVGRKYDKLALKPAWELGFVYLSGDKPGTDKHEGWDPLFSRNPYWNELLIYTLTLENIRDSATPGYWTNLQMFRAGLKLTFSPETNLALSYQYLRSNEQANTIAPFAGMFGTGKERGHLPTAMLNHKFSKNVDGFLQLEYFAPGNFYAKSADPATFFRWQLQLKI